MGTLISINSIASKESKPDIVNITMRANYTDMDVKSLIKKLEYDRNKMKLHIINSSSYRQDSYRQNSLSINQNYYKETIYSNDEGNKLSSTEYNKLPYNERAKYTNVEIIKKFTGYSADLYVSAILDVNDKTVIDVINLYDMCIDHSFDFKYVCNLSDVLADKMLQECYSDCINDGITKINNIISNVHTMKSKTINILEIIDPAAESSTLYASAPRHMMLNSEITQTTSAEPVITKELIQDLFETPKEIKYNLTIRAEIV